MTKINALGNAIKTCDIKPLLDWLEDYALWFDPGGYWDEMETIKYLTSEEEIFDCSDGED